MALVSIVFLKAVCFSLMLNHSNNAKIIASNNFAGERTFEIVSCHGYSIACGKHP